MAIISCIVTAARDHENADRLRVYQVEAPGLVESTQIVANKDNIYEVGTVVAAALVGTVLSDGTKIEKGKIRGVLSFGMLLGRISDPVGTDHTSTFLATHVEKQVDESTGVIEDSNWPRYTSLDGFLRIKNEVLAVPEVVVTEKLHGSSWRFGFTPTRNFVVGSHTARVIDSRMSSGAWPSGHLIQKALAWIERENIRDRVDAYRSRLPEVTSLGVYGEICGWKCSDLHYGQTSESTPGVKLFGEVTVDGRFLGWNASLKVLRELFPDLEEDWMVPILYRGPPDLAVFKKLRDQPSEYARRNGAQQVSEGIIIRPTTEKLSPGTMNRLVAKYKGPLYEERKSLRDKDPNQLPTYVTAYDLLADFVTDERILHVLAKAELGGLVIEPKAMNKVIPLLYKDIRKESVGEWPAGSENLDEGVLVRWLHDIACGEVARVIQDRQKGAY